MKKETLVSIAERSGCSISTVSRVLSGNAAKYRISQRTVARVTEEVKRCNYTPSLLAKGLRTNRTDTIGLLIPNIENSFFANVAGVVIRESRNYNYKVVVVDTQEDERNEQDGLSALLARRVDGIVAAPCGSNAELFASVQEGGMPLVLIDRYLPDAGMLSYVTTDNYRGAVMAAEYLLENGHRRIACIQGTPHSMPVRDRVRGFRRHAAGARPRGPDRGDGGGFSVQNGYLETKLGAGPGGASHGDFRGFEQPDPARGGEGGARIGPADSRRHFGRVVRRQHAFQLPRPGDYLHRPAYGRDRHAGREAAHPRHPRTRCGAFAPAACRPSLVIRRSVRNLLLWSKRKAHRICSILLSEQTYLYCNVMGYFDNDTFSLQILNQYFIVVGANQVYYIAP